MKFALAISYFMKGSYDSIGLKEKNKIMINIVYYDEGLLPEKVRLDEENFRASLLYYTAEEAIISLRKIMEHGLEHAYYNPETHEYQNGNVSSFMIMILDCYYEEERYRGSDVEAGVKAIQEIGKELG